MRKIAALAAVFCLLLASCSPAASEVPPVAYEPESYEENGQEPEPFEILLPEEPEEEPASEEYEPYEPAQYEAAVPEQVTAPLAHAAQTDQIIIGHYWPAADIDWEVTITDLNDIASIEGFLRGRQPVHHDGPLPMGGIPPHMSLVLDGVPMSFSFGVVRSLPGVPQDRDVLWESGSFYSVDWRIWRVLSRYGGFDERDLISAMPRRQLSQPQGDTFTMGQVFEQNGVQPSAIRLVRLLSFVQPGSDFDVIISDPAAIQSILNALATVQLNSNVVGERLHYAHPTIFASFATDDFSVGFSLNETAFAHFKEDATFAFYGLEGAQLHSMLAALLETAMLER